MQKSVITMQGLNTSATAKQQEIQMVSFEPLPVIVRYSPLRYVKVVVLFFELIYIVYCSCE